MTVVDVSIDRKAQQEHLNSVCERGVQACRHGDWESGLVDLAWLVQGKQAKQLPGLCYSYLGYGIAHRQREVDRGRKLCRHAVKIEWFQPDNYYNLARTCMLAERYRQEAVDAVLEGLKVDPEHEGLVQLNQKIGYRRPPVLGFLPRTNVFNRILGSLRHAVQKPASTKKPLPVEPADSDSVIVG